jgi:hypothetical protein
VLPMVWLLEDDSDDVCGFDSGCSAPLIGRQPASELAT